MHTTTPSEDSLSTSLETRELDSDPDSSSGASGSGSSRTSASAAPSVLQIVHLDSPVASEETPEDRRARIAMWRSSRYARNLFSTMGYLLYLVLSCAYLSETWARQTNSYVPTAVPTWIFAVVGVFWVAFWLWNLLQQVICSGLLYTHPEPAWVRFRDYLPEWMQVVVASLLFAFAFLVVITVGCIREGSTSASAIRMWFVVDVHVLMAANLVWFWLP